MIDIRVSFFILVAALFAASCSDSSGVITTEISSTQTLNHMGSTPITPYSTSEPIVTVSASAGAAESSETTVVLATQSATSAATMIPDNSVESPTVGPARYQAPIGSRQDRLFLPNSNLFVDFTVYEGVPGSIYQDVRQAILTTANILPLPVVMLGEAGQLFVAIWHREKTDFQAVVVHRCEYMPTPSSETCQNDLIGPMSTQSQGMALLARSPARFEIVWPTLDQHDFLPASYWISASHEWVHVFQSAHTVTNSEVNRSLTDIPLAGPIWLHEGTADYLAALIADKQGSINFGSVMSEYIRNSHDAFVSSDSDPELILGSCESPADQVNAERSGDSWQCSTGRVAVAYLMYKIGASSINELKAFYTDLNQYSWSEAFTRNYGRSPKQFYKEFAEFMEMSYELKLAFISQPEVSQ